MKLFQQLLVAPAALGLMAPLAANAAELNLNDVSDYSASSAEVTNISNFSDVYPTDWAFKALTDLARRHGCAASIPTGSITRYEAAALLNQCLDNVAQVNDEERRLINEFGSELAVIKGRVDGLEAGIGEFEAGAFSGTTKLSGEAHMIVGAVEGAGISGNEALTSIYKWTANLKTSYTGEDALVAKIETGNGSASTDFEELEHYETGSSALDIEELHYTFPVGDNFTVVAGAHGLDSYAALGATTSAYDAGILDILSYSGAPDIYNAGGGAGAGVTYAKDGWTVGAGFASSDAADASKGMLTKEGTDVGTVQIGYENENWGAALAYADADTYSAYGFSAFYTPDEAGAMPSISAGIGGKDPETSGHDDETTWMVGLQWDEVGPGKLGIGYGTAAGHRDATTTQDGNASYPDHDQMAYEVWYAWPVTDNITITPAWFATEQYSNTNTDLDSKSGFIVKTTFKF